MKTNKRNKEMLQEKKIPNYKNINIIEIILKKNSRYLRYMHYMQRKLRN